MDDELMMIQEDDEFDETEYDDDEGNAEYEDDLDDEEFDEDMAYDEFGNPMPDVVMEPLETVMVDSPSQETPAGEPPVQKKKPGRPPGSKNRPKPRKPGRPPGSKNKKKPRPAPPSFDYSTVPEVYKCVTCGMKTADPRGKFYSSARTAVYNGNSHYVHVCVDCCDKYYEEQKIRHQDERIALILTCNMMHIYFSERAYFSCRSRGEIKIGSYISTLNIAKDRATSPETFLVDVLHVNDAIKDDTFLREDQEGRWTAGDQKNRSFVLQSIGYDCFDDRSYTETNRKFLFNTLADYLTDDVLEDPHKTQSAISLVKSMLHLEQMDRAINAEMRRNNPDYDAIAQYSKIKDSIVANISKIANDNGISAKSSGRNNRSNSTLSFIMKEMADNNYDDIKVNVIDAKQSEAYRHIAEQNAKALQRELAFTADEFASMVAEQSVMIRELTEKNERIEEELRETRLLLRAKKS